MSKTTPQSESKKIHGVFGFFVNMIMGGSAAAVSKTLMAPIERVKLVM